MEGRKVMNALLRLAAAATLAVSAVLATPASAQPTQLSMGGSTTTTPFFAYYSAVARSISQSDPGLNVTVVSTGGFATNIRQMIGGQMSFGGVSPDLLEDAETAATPFRDFRVLWWAVPAVQYVVVRADSPVRSLSDLNGRCFHAGMRGSSSEKNMLRIIRALGYTPQHYPADAADAINAIRTGRCLGQARTGGNRNVDANTAELALTVPLRPIGFTDAEIARVQREIPWMSFREVPAGVLGAGPFRTHELMVGFAATTRMSDDIAYRVVRGMHSGIAEQREAFAPLRDTDVIANTMSVRGVKLHPGAIRFYREIGVQVPAELVP
jgi:TRAP transporter TAXI family solute receptor